MNQGISFHRKMTDQKNCDIDARGPQNTANISECLMYHRIRSMWSPNMIPIAPEMTESHSKRMKAKTNESWKQWENLNGVSVTEGTLTWLGQSWGDRALGRTHKPSIHSHSPTHKDGLVTSRRQTPADWEKDEQLAPSWERLRTPEKVKKWNTNSDESMVKPQISLVFWRK